MADIQDFLFGKSLFAICVCQCYAGYMDLELKCIKCGLGRDKGRKMCRPCYLEYKREIQKDKYYTEGRYMYSLICVACQNPFEGFRKEEIFCDACWEAKKAFRSETRSTNNYIYVGYKGKHTLWEHRRVAEQILGRKLTVNEIVHHLDNNPKNNAPENLLIMDRRAHTKLHNYLDNKRVIFEKSKNENSENCWNNLILSLTTTWLEITNVKVIKLGEVGQSAAEPLSNEEGSETMHGTPNSTGEDIVQTTTLQAATVT